MIETTQYRTYTDYSNVKVEFSHEDESNSPIFLVVGNDTSGVSLTIEEAESIRKDLAAAIRQAKG